MGGAAEVDRVAAAAQLRCPLDQISGRMPVLPRYGLFGAGSPVGVMWIILPRSVSSLCAGVLVIRQWRPREVWRFEGEAEPVTAMPSGLTPRRVARAWMPFALLTAFVLVWGIPASKGLGTPAVKEWLDHRLSWKPELGWLHLKVARGPAVTGHETPTAQDLEKAQLEFVPLSATVR